MINNNISVSRMQVNIIWASKSARLFCSPSLWWSHTHSLSSPLLYVSFSICIEWSVFAPLPSTSISCLTNNAIPHSRLLWIMVLYSLLHSNPSITLLRFHLSFAAYVSLLHPLCPRYRNCIHTITYVPDTTFFHQRSLPSASTWVGNAALGLLNMPHNIRLDVSGNSPERERRYVANLVSTNRWWWRVNTVLFTIYSIELSWSCGCQVQ